MTVSSHETFYNCNSGVAAEELGIYDRRDWFALFLSFLMEFITFIRRTSFKGFEIYLLSEKSHLIKCSMVSAEILKLLMKYRLSKTSRCAFNYSQLTAIQTPLPVEPLGGGVGSSEIYRKHVGWWIAFVCVIRGSNVLVACYMCDRLWCSASSSCDPTWSWRLNKEGIDCVNCNAPRLHFYLL